MINYPKVFAALVGLVLCTVEQCYAAACCSGGTAVPALITGDNRFQIGASLDTSFVVGEVNSRGKSLFYNDITEDISGGILLTAAYRLHEQVQTGFKLPIRTRYTGSKSSSNIGDVKLNFGWEPFPIYHYSKWRPKAFVFAGMTFPSGKSTYESADSRDAIFGRGFFSPSVGAVVIKSWRSWDIQAAGEWIYQLERGFRSERVDPGSIITGTLGVGYSYRAWHLGVSVGVNYEASKVLKRAGVTADEKLVWDTILELSRRMSDRVSINVSYLDQSLLGPAKNVLLTRSIGLGFTFRQPV